MQIKFAPIAALVLSTASLFGQATQTITGTVTDSMCGAHHMMKDKTPAECTRECVKEGSDFALAVGDKIYTLKGDRTAFDKFAGEKVTVKGQISGNTVTVRSIAAPKP